MHKFIQIFLIYLLDKYFIYTFFLFLFLFLIKFKN